MAFIIKAWKLLAWFVFLKDKEKKNDDFPDHTYNDMIDDNITIWKNQEI